MPVSTRSDLLAASGPSATDSFFNAQRYLVPLIAEAWKVAAAAGDLDNEWIDVRGTTLAMFQLDATGTFTATIQGSINGGKNFYDLTNEAAGSSLTLSGIYRYRGAYEYMRFKSSAVQASNTVTISVSLVGGA